MTTISANRSTIRHLAAAMAAIAAAIYLLIGFQAVAVIDEVADQPAFGIPAGIAFALAAIVLARFDNRVVWAVGAVLQALIILMYFAVSGQRTPPFEVWGVLIRGAQVVLFVALVLLAVTPTQRHATAAAAAG